VKADTTNSANSASFPGGVGNDQVRFREALVEGGNLLDSQPDAKFWAGERYYRRHLQRILEWIKSFSGFRAIISGHF